MKKSTKKSVTAPVATVATVKVKTVKSSKKSTAVIGILQETVVVKSSSRKGTTYKRLTVEQKLEIITARKRRGDIQRVAAELNVPSTYVSGVVTGRRKDIKVINNIYDKVRGRKVAEYTV
jgi:hypothetical protein